MGSLKSHNIKCRFRIEDLFSDNEEGKQRLREAVERKGHWLAGQVEKEDRNIWSVESEVPADTEGGFTAMATKDELEDR